MIKTRQRILFKFFFTLLIFPFLQNEILSAEENCGDEECCYSPLPANQFYVGPEGYYLKRTRKGGTKQTGAMWGGQAGFDFIRRNSFYWGAEGYYATGRLEGHSGSGNKIKSRNQEWELEGRVGYTLQTECAPYYTVTPFVTYGYFEETNKYLKDFPFSVRFRNKFEYVGGGILSSVFITPSINVGLQFKVSYMVKGVQHVSNDPEYQHFSIEIDNRLQYDVELPINYITSAYCQPFAVSLVPFYRFRNYGGRRGYPFDFFETKFDLVGAKVLLTYLF
jgi:hypothetical protein